MHLPKLFDAFKQQVDLEGIVMNSMQMWASFHLSLIYSALYSCRKRGTIVFLQHTARHERLDTLCGDEFQGFRGVSCQRDDCELNVLHNTSRNLPG